MACHILSGCYDLTQYERAVIVKTIKLTFVQKKYVVKDNTIQPTVYNKDISSTMYKANFLLKGVHLVQVALQMTEQ